MELLLFIIGIMADGSVRAQALDTFTEARTCLRRAREVNAMPDNEDVRWSNAGCIQIPARDRQQQEMPDVSRGTRI